MPIAAVLLQHKLFIKKKAPVNLQLMLKSNQANEIIFALNA